MSQPHDPKELFGSTPIPKLFFTAALPGAVGMLVSSIYGTMDGILVGNFIGETPFAAINLAMPFVIVLFAFWGSHWRGICRPHLHRTRREP